MMESPMKIRLRRSPYSEELKSEFEFFLVQRGSSRRVQDAGHRGHGREMVGGRYNFLNFLLEIESCIGPFTFTMLSPI